LYMQMSAPICKIAILLFICACSYSIISGEEHVTRWICICRACFFCWFVMFFLFRCIL
jgi:hypothetical protein